MLAAVILPAALTRTFGIMTGRRSVGWMLFGVMAALFVVGLLISGIVEQRGNPHVANAAGIQRAVTSEQPGGNMEGKEVRFGISGSVLTSNTTSNTATGSFNSMHDSYMPLANAVPLTNMLIGELIFGGLGSGLYSMIIMVLLALFFAGLMIGRTPEFLGQKFAEQEMRLIGPYVLAFPFAVLCLTAVAVSAGAGPAGLTINGGGHGFTQILFAYASSAANNGLTMASLNANSIFYNTTTMIAMLVGRFVLAALALAIAGQFARGVQRPETARTSVPAGSVLFAGYLIAIIAIIGGLTYFIALALGPIAEQLGS
jgi:K+-transporting ATPase ATPase A chain